MVDPSSDETDWTAMYAAFQKQALSIGTVTVSWNMCQLLVFAIFYDLSGMTWEKARAVFFALKADVQQREITLALAQELPATRSPRKKIVAAVSKLNELANERNVTVHTMWQVSEEHGRLIPAQDVKHNAKLDMANPFGQFDVLNDKLEAAHKMLVKAVVASALHRPLRDKADAQKRDPGGQ